MSCAAWRLTLPRGPGLRVPYTAFSIAASDPSRCCAAPRYRAATRPSRDSMRQPTASAQACESLCPGVNCRWMPMPATNANGRGWPSPLVLSLYHDVSIGTTPAHLLNYSGRWLQRTKESAQRLGDELLAPRRPTRRDSGKDRTLLPTRSIALLSSHFFWAVPPRASKNHHTSKPLFSLPRLEARQR